MNKDQLARRHSLAQELQALFYFQSSKQMRYNAEREKVSRRASLPISIESHLFL